MVAAGILVSRLAGLVRVRFFSHYFGQQSLAADAFNAAFRIPNLLQNLFGEGALSGSFIPVYSGLRARGRPRPLASFTSSWISCPIPRLSTSMSGAVSASPVMPKLSVPL